MGVIWCLHGFLGRGGDWYFLRDDGFEVRAPSLFSGDSLDDLRPSPSDTILGYSMGARLALRLVAQWGAGALAGAVLVSAGITYPEPGRRELDETWARRFESEPWDSVVEAWNAQTVFGGRKNPLVRNEGDFDRGASPEALRAVVAR